MYRKGTEFLRDFLHIKIHPDKIYIQEATKGVKFVGSVIKPGRIYLSARTISGLDKKLEKLEKLCKKILRTPPGSRLNSLYDLKHYISSCNSYMGFLIHCSTYAIRVKMYERLNYF